MRKSAFARSARAFGGFGRKAVALAAVGVLAAVVLAGCGEEESSSGGDGAAAALKKVTVRLDWLTAPTSAGFWVADAQGFYEDAGLDVEVREGTGSSATAQSVAANQDTFGYVSGNALSDAVAADAPLKAVAAPLNDSGAAFMSLKEVNITTPEDLVGKSVGVAGDTYANYLPALLETNNIDAKSVKVQNAPSAAMYPGLLAKRWDATGSSYVNLVLEGKAETSYLRLSEFGVPTLPWAIVAKEDTIADDPDLVKAFVSASLKGFEWASANPAEVGPIIQERVPDYQYMNSSEKAQTAMAELLKPEEEGRPVGWISADTWEEGLAILSKFGALESEPPPVDEFITNRFVDPDAE